jgi:hypothetical protein
VPIVRAISAKIDAWAKIYSRAGRQLKKTRLWNFF